MTSSPETQGKRVAGEVVSGALMEVRGAVLDLESALVWAEYRELYSLWEHGQLKSEPLLKRLGYLHKRLSDVARGSAYTPFTVIDDENSPVIDEIVVTD